jgi:hypothetical protein
MPAHDVQHTGLSARKSRGRLTIDNYGGFMLVNPYNNSVVSGERFDLTAQQVIDMCNEQGNGLDDARVAAERDLEDGEG